MVYSPLLGILITSSTRERLPDSEETPGEFAETTEIVTHPSPSCSVADAFDAATEIRAVDSAKCDHDAEERWHGPSRDLTTQWVLL
jgi:hypothetical protein